VYLVLSEDISAGEHLVGLHDNAQVRGTVSEGSVGTGERFVLAGRSEPKDTEKKKKKSVRKTRNQILYHLPSRERGVKEERGRKRAETDKR
jgi:hypothetical protein